MNRLARLSEYGQSFWLDNLTRGMIRSGELERRVREQHLGGVTSNPAIFDKALSKGTDYDDDIARLTREGQPPQAIYEFLTTSDVREGCDVLRPVYESSDGSDGFVSLEVSPHLARDTDGTIAEARRLWKGVDRPNLMIKVPGTLEGIPAFETLIGEGINVNVTLLFAVDRYEAVAEAYLRALERRVEAGQPVAAIASVASFFLSRIDSLVDKKLEAMIDPEGQAQGTDPRPVDLLGLAAVANAKLAYQVFRRLLESDRWRHLAAKGAKAQRLLWASTSTKNPRYADVRYVDPLVGPWTVNTMPEETAVAFDDHGNVAFTVEDGVSIARQTLEDLAKLGIDLKAVTDQLEEEGIRKFIEPFDASFQLIAGKQAA